MMIKIKFLLMMIERHFEVVLTKLLLKQSQTK